MRLKRALIPALLLAAALTASCAIEPETEDYYSLNRVKTVPRIQTTVYQMSLISYPIVCLQI